MSSLGSVLVVDDDDTFRTRLVEAFTHRGYEASGARDAREAVARATCESPEYAVVDLKMPGASGLTVVRALHELDATTRIVMLTAFGSIATTVDAMRAGAINYLSKPANLDQILAAFHPEGAAGEAQPVALPASLARVEWEHIQQTLQAVGGNITQAAKALGIHRRSLQRKLDKYPAAR